MDIHRIPAFTPVALKDTNEDIAELTDYLRNLLKDYDIHTQHDIINNIIHNAKAYYQLI